MREAMADPITPMPMQPMRVWVGEIGFGYGVAMVRDSVDCGEDIVE